MFPRFDAFFFCRQKRQFGCLVLLASAMFLFGVLSSRLMSKDHSEHSEERVTASTFPNAKDWKHSDLINLQGKPTRPKPQVLEDLALSDPSKITEQRDDSPIQKSETEGHPLPDMLVSKVWISHVQPKNKSQTKYTSNLRFGHEMLEDGKPLLDGPISFQPERKPAAEVREFLSRKSLIQTPFDTDVLSPYLTSTRQVIDEAQRVHFKLFTDLFRSKKYAVLFQVAAQGNRGDSAISVGEFTLLERMGIEVLFFSGNGPSKNEDEVYAQALAITRRYPKEQVVVLLQGGGNLIGYYKLNVWREKALRHFRTYSTILLSQSIYMSGDKDQFRFSRELYCCNPDLTIILRDRLSLRIAQRLFNNGTRLLLAPDMAFQIGPLSRHVLPYYDVSWHQRDDGEHPDYSGKSPETLFSANITVSRWDWRRAEYLHEDNTVKKAINIMETGFSILQRGRVVVTDRLHGHILSTLLDIPHVLLDNADNKLSAYHNTWTRGLHNCRLASTVEEAARYAMDLLRQYDHQLPPRMRAVDLPPYKA